MKQTIVLLTILMLGWQATGQARPAMIDISDRILTKNYYLTVYPILFGQKATTLIKSFAQEIARQPAAAQARINQFIRVRLF